MIRKLFAALTLLAACLVAPITLAGPAEAACGDASKATSIDRDVTHAGGGTEATYRHRYTIWYRNCDGYSVFDRYQIRITRLAGWCGPLETFELNPNAVGSGGYNPGIKNDHCENGDPDDITYWDPVNPITVWDDAPGNERCIGTTVTEIKNNMTDPSWQTPTLCMP